MFKREMKINFKNFAIYLTILIGIFLVVFLIYPSIAKSNNIQAINEMMKVFPEELLKSFNMDLSTLDSAYGWLKSEGFIFILLIIGCYSGILGSNILLKEESDKTIEYLNSLPIRRTSIILNKVIVGIIYITTMVIALSIFNYIGISLNGSFDKQQYLLLSITPLFPSYVLFFICLFISTYTHKTKKMFGISLGIVMLSYVLQILSTIANETEFLKYLTVFTLADTRNVLTSISINPAMIIISIALSSAFLLLTIVHYNKKELV